MPWRDLPFHLITSSPEIVECPVCSPIGSPPGAGGRGDGQRGIYLLRTVSPSLETLPRFPNGSGYARGWYLELLWRKSPDTVILASGDETAFVAGWIEQTKALSV